MTPRVHLTLKSDNVKTGPIPVSTTSARTCPAACPLAKGGCYATGGPLALHWRKITEGERGTDWSTFVESISQLPQRQLWRHNQAGDLPGEGDSIDIVALLQLVRANRGRRGFTYTHKPPTPENLDAIELANARGFTVNLSANNLEHADALASASVAPVVVVLPAEQTTNVRTPEGRLVVVCPATKEGSSITCASCGLCSRSNRPTIVGFPAHGASKRKASAIAEGGTKNA